MNTEYLERVLVYLKREMPAFSDAMFLKEQVIVFKLPRGQQFQPFYERVFQEINRSVTRKLKRESDLEFRIWSANQERDFKILK